jgi:MerR family transcriptional regulator, aldehyde-responsive regulator
MMNPNSSYTIQEISAETDLPSSTLRYYEEIGLLDPIPRAANGHRRYSQSDLHRVILIKRLRLTGMSIERMIEFVALYRGGTSTARQRREILQAHRETVQARVDELLEMMGFIDYKIGLYQDEEAEYEREQKYEVPIVG